MRQSRSRNPAAHLTIEDRARGGRHSAEIQRRDAFGHFAGLRRGGNSAGRSAAGRSSSRSSSRSRSGGGNGSRGNYGR